MEFIRRTAQALLVTAWIVVTISGAQSALKTPVWPSSFSVRFHEKDLNIFHRPITTENDGAWYYDYSIPAARHDHLQGQNNTYCQGRGLNLTDPHADCSLLYVDNRDMYVHYPGERQCCRACGPDEGCTMMSQTNLAQATNYNNETFNGTACVGWSIPPEKYPIDQWYMTEIGTPCYWETIPIVHPFIVSSHSLTFDQHSYHVGPIPQDLLKVPSYCLNICPNPYVPPH
ncbi:uncharacterized protein LOC118423501 [Branchiostoma floridae]|uniref:Uncharacterized protein LOC118423501 n=1 Tax=Branchiostoma floridae TaxID=7739 RepID=C3ZMC4_BRAFL|nr:uncharacterized protein LOC118423501 [Branchiostoma floridae]|eukprot:XP_002590369.1 hypothetical protein BRAFLDRAFT_76642 [Branchiostoma floridae]